MTTAQTNPAAMPHGIVLFYEDKGPPESLAGLRQPEVTGGEVIAWWADLEPIEGQYDWSRIDAHLAAWGAQGKRLDVRLSGAHAGPNYSPPWLFERGRVRRVGRGPFEDFEKPGEHYSLAAGARVLDEAGRRFARVDQPGTWMTHAELLTPGRYSMQWDQRVAKPGGFRLVAHDTTNRQPDVVFAFGDKAGDWRGEGAELDLPGPALWQLSWRLDGPGALDIDNVLVLPVSDSRAMTPVPPGIENSAWQLLDGAALAEMTGDHGGTPGVRFANASAAPMVAMRNDASVLPIQKHHGYAVGVRWQANADSRLVVRLARDGEETTRQVVDLKAGERGGKVFHFMEMALITEEGLSLEFLLDGPGDVTLGDLTVRDWSRRVPVFPDYFSDEFRACWERFVAAFAERYNGHPALGVVSVGGVGRWEETILDEDAYGLLDAQWIARGYTRERYLAQIEWALDLYKRALDRQPLRLCLAYGLHDRPDVDFTYWRVAQACARRGIGLKQNGMSEKYDAWPGSTNTHTSQLFMRYADTRGVSLTHETGGQIHRNTLNAHGHPLSLFNRLLLNQTDVLFLYGGDVAGRHVRKYQAYLAEQMGASCRGQFYAQLGDYSLVNEQSPRPVQYRNNWIGLRQFNRPAAEALYTTHDGERCVATSTGNPTIVFDLDDRWQHAGLFGALFSLSYLDAGTEPFNVDVFDQSTGARRTLGRVERGGTNAWKVAMFADSAWCQSRHNHGENMHEDVFVEHLAGEPVTIRSAELRFVGGSEWALRDVERPALSSSGSSRLSEQAVSVDVAISDRTACIAAVELPLSVASLVEASVSLRVYAKKRGAAGEVLLADKEWYMPADGDWARVPLAWSSDIASLRVEATATGDTIAWKHAEGSTTPCVAVLAYDTRDGSVSPMPHGALRLQDKVLTAGPFTGFRLTHVPPGTRGDIRIERTSQHFSSPAVVVDWRDVPLDEPVWFEPQPGGIFEVDIAMPTGVPTTTPTLVFQELHRRRTPRPPIEREATSSPIAQWTLDQLERGRAPLDAGAALMTPSGLALRARPSQRVRIDVVNTSSSSLMRLFWRGPGESFSAARSMLIPVVSNDPTPRVVSFPVGFEDTWKGTIDQLALVRAYSHHDEDALGMTVNTLAIEETTRALDLAFDSTPDSMEPLKGVGTMRREDGCWRVEVPAGEVPWLVVPRAVFDFDAEEDHRLTLRMRVDGADAGEARVRWHWLGHPTLDARGAMQADHEMGVSIPWHHEPGQWAEADIALGEVASWRGRINALGFSPFVKAHDKPTVVWIDTLRIQRVPVPDDAAVSMSR